MTNTTVQFRAERDSLLDTFGHAARSVSARGGMLPILSTVRIEVGANRLAATGSDLDMTITAACDVVSVHDGDVCIPAKLASDIIRSLEPGIVTITVTDTDDAGLMAHIEGGRSNFDLRVSPSDEYPRLPTVDTAGAVTVNAVEFAAALRQVVPAASNDDNRPIITGVLTTVEDTGLRLVTTDSYRLAVKDVPGVTVFGNADRTSVLIPSRAYMEVIRAVGKSEKLTVTIEERNASFVTGDTTILTRLIEGEFPNYKGLIPSSYPNVLTVAREALLVAVRRVRLLARDSTPIRLQMEAGKVTLRAITQDVGEAVEDVDASYNGVDLTVAFNPEYLAQGLDSMEADEVQLETIDALKPAVLRPLGSTDHLYLLMPVRVS